MLLGLNFMPGLFKRASSTTYKGCTLREHGKKWNREHKYLPDVLKICLHRFIFPAWRWQVAHMAVLYMTLYMIMKNHFAENM